VKGQLFSNEAGGTIVIVFLILLPLLIMVNVHFNENERLLTGSNITLKNTVVLAAKAAAQSVDSTSQAHGTPLIDPVLSHENFRKSLAKNLKLDGDFVPYNNSPLTGTISYHLLICNGTNDFGTSEGVIYEYKDENLADTLLSTGTLPLTFGVNSDFNPWQDGKTVTFDKPGVIAIVEAEIRPILMSSTRDKKTTRWAAAKIVY